MKPTLHEQAVSLFTSPIANGKDRGQSINQKTLDLHWRGLGRDSPNERVRCVDDNRYEFESVGGTAADTKTD
jgi:hypothetical protein